MSGVITASEPSWTAPFTGLRPRQYDRLITTLWREGADSVRRGRPWSLSPEHRALLVAARRRTNLTMRRLAPLFEVSKSAANRVIDHLGPSLALQQRRRFRKNGINRLKQHRAAATRFDELAVRVAAIHQWL